MFHESTAFKRTLFELFLRDDRGLRKLTRFHLIGAEG